MALVLAMQLGRSIFVGDTQVELLRFVAPGELQVKVHGKSMDQLHVLTDTQRVELLPNVYAQIGLGGSASMFKIVLEAPKSVHILRDTLYYQNRPAA